METNTKLANLANLDINSIIKCSALSNDDVYVVKGVMQRGFKKEVLLVGGHIGDGETVKQSWYDVKSLGEITIIS